MARLKAKLDKLQASGVTTGQDAALKKEVGNLRESRKLLEQTILDANRMLSEKAEEVRALQDELHVAHDTATKLQVSLVSSDDSCWLNGEVCKDKRKMCATIEACIMLKC